MTTMTHVISAFPGCGKTTTYLNLKEKIKILDSDSSLFDKAYFPTNYIEHIKENIGKVDIIFVSSHKVVRDALNNNNINYTIYYPSKERKKEMMDLYKQRGNNEKFLKFLNDNFESFIDDIDNDNIKNKIKLKNEGDFILNDKYFNRILNYE